MTTTFDKAKERQNKEKKNKKKWWIINTKNYSYYIWALPIIPFCWVCDKIESLIDKSLKWNEEKAKKILDKTLPKILKWDEEEKNYYLYIRSYYGFNWERVPLIYKKWSKKFSYCLKEYFLDKYENELYIKKVEREDYGEWYYITFTEKN
jgi:hypothetical protein